MPSPVRQQGIPVRQQGILGTVKLHTYTAGVKQSHCVIAVYEINMKYEHIHDQSGSNFALRALVLELDYIFWQKREPSCRCSTCVQQTGNAHKQLHMIWWL